MISSSNSPKLSLGGGAGYDSDLELTRASAVERRFFRTGRDSSWKYDARCKAIFGEMMSIRTGASRSSCDVDLSNTPGRLPVVAEACVNQEAFPKGQSNGHGYFSISRFVEGHQSSYKGFPVLLTRTERVILTPPMTGGGAGVVSCAHKVNPHKNHKGDCVVDFVQDGTNGFITNGGGTYRDLLREINVLTSGLKEKEAAIATLLLGFPKKFSTISQADLSHALGVDSSLISERQSAFINTLAYLLFVKEIARRQSPDDEVSHNVPWAISLIKGLKFVEAGHLRLHEVLGPNAPYGPFTGTNIGANMALPKEKMKKINRIYREKFPETPVTSSSKEATKKGTARSFFKQELIDVYGGASDTDHDGYESPC